MAPQSFRSTFSYSGLPLDDFVAHSQRPEQDSIASQRRHPTSHGKKFEEGGGEDFADFTSGGGGSISDQLSIFTNVSSASSVYSNNCSSSDSSKSHLACSYCGLRETKCLVQCVKSKKWFCNSTNQVNISHILLHLVKSRNKEILLHPDCISGDAVIECYACHCRNIFVLGYISSLDGEKVIILCRSPCATNTNFRDDIWQVSQWNPLISERKLLGWLVENAPSKCLQETRRFRMSQVQQLEEHWSSGNTDITIQDIQDPSNALMSQMQQSQEENNLHPTLTIYESTAHYRQIMGPLIKIEADYEKKLKESQSINNITVRWQISSTPSSLNSPMNTSKNVVFFSLGDGNDDVKVLNGDELKLKLAAPHISSKNWECNGIVVKIPNLLSNEIGLELKENRVSKLPSNITKGFSVEFVWKSAPFDRMKLAMRLFSQNNQNNKTYLSHFLQEKLLGHEISDSKGYSKVPYPSNYAVPNLSDLNSGQVYAINHVLRNALTLIQGPPGTGKTITSAAVIYHLIKQKVSQRILVCAPSNIAVDHLAEKLHQIGLKIVRIAARSREFIESSVDYLMLNHQVESYLQSESLKPEKNSDSNDSAEISEVSKLCQKLIKLRLSDNSEKSEDDKKHQRLLDSLRKCFVSVADVVCCTCSNATPRKLFDLTFDTVLIDESTQAKDVECLVPIVNGCKKLILIGDHCQLGPIVLSKQAENAGLGQSLFERLLILSNKPHRLQVQYRMHPIIAQFPSNLFYEGSLQNGVTAEERTIASVRHIFPQKNKPMFFYCSFGFEEIAGTGTSYLNRSEASQVLNLVTKFVKCGIHPKQIGIITPYEGQRSFIFQYMKHSGELNAKIYSEIEVSNVDSFQGREKDFIILSCVRSNEIASLGFLSDPRRLNVLITRSKYGLIIIGNPKALATNQLWHQLITFYKKMQLLVEGPLNSLKESFVPIPKPKKITISTSKQQISPSALNSKYLSQTAMLFPNPNLSTPLHMTSFNANMPIPYSLMFSLPANCIKLQVHNQQNQDLLRNGFGHSSISKETRNEINDLQEVANTDKDSKEGSNYHEMQKSQQNNSNFLMKNAAAAANAANSAMDANDLINGMLNPNLFGLSGIEDPTLSTANNIFEVDQMIPESEVKFNKSEQRD